VDYTFGQVSLDQPFVEFNSNCGNISAAVGPFAIDTGLVRPVEPMTTVRIHMTNFDKIMVAQVPVSNGKAAVDGDFAIDGVPGTGARIALDWSDVIGGTTGKLLPTGHVTDVIAVEGRNYTVSIVDAGTISIFVKASELGMTGVETPREIEANYAPLLEKVRGKAAESIGLISDYRDSLKKIPYLPYLCPVTEATDYMCFNKTRVKKEDIDFVSRLYNMGLASKTYGGTSAVCTGVAARIEGSVVNRLLGTKSGKKELLYIGHAAGRFPVEAELVPDAKDLWRVERVNIFRTARILMEGYANVRRSALEK
jgi:2-methylaconitate cis-trans-isomerase PrpF